MFGVRVNATIIEGRPKPKLVGIMTDYPPRSNEIFGPSMAIVMAIIEAVWKTSIPSHLVDESVRVITSIVRSSAAVG
jgi:hypothetical protein